ncbi:GDP-L-fucose synthase family protein [Pelagibacterium lacus]|uniref:GDP-L-fucose synthase n=1 Tax=Pelagibacterium lacus TaxID=2282655 RepID=A0A369WAS9_9HYPH|nr:GDP-L-fucose synthase [Pelagibacterium lacus]RDE09181.1 GDP-L-fucose synthase [Pelagibacterium lacus]
MFELAGKRVWIAGHRGMVGSALMRRLAREACEIVTVDRKTLDLRRQSDVEAWLVQSRPDAIIVAAAQVGGIWANATRPVDFLLDNLQIATNIFAAAHACDVDRLLFLGSSCIYPRDASQPIAEEALLTGPLEATNQWYAIAKIAGIKLAQAYRRQYGRNYISAQPTNLYGPDDNFDPASSHVLPALIRKAHEAKMRGDSALTLWGTGTPRREFLHCDDCADALVLLLQSWSDDTPVNIGTGEDISILELARLVCDIVGFAGDILHDLDKPDGAPAKRLDISRLQALGWTPAVRLRDGIARTYQWFIRYASGERPR